MSDSSPTWHTRLRLMTAMLRAAGDAWMDDDVPRLAASLAFYTVLSLVPFLIVLSAIAISALGKQAAQGTLAWELTDLIGPTGAQAIQALIRSDRQASTAATIFGSLFFAFGASAFVMELRDALNTIWHVPSAAASSSVANFVRLVTDRFYLFGLILGAGLLLLASLALNAYVAAATAHTHVTPQISPSLLHGAVFVASFIIITVLFAAVYKIVPDVRLDWRDVFVGACFTSFLFTIGKQVIGIYLGRVNYASTYGATGSVLIILVWVYYSAQLFFFGAEFTRAYAKRRHPLIGADAAHTSQPV